jgi:hypothetical protein
MKVQPVIALVLTKGLVWLQDLVLAAGSILTKGLAVAKVFNIFYKLLILVISNSFNIYILI